MNRPCNYRTYLRNPDVDVPYQTTHWRLQKIEQMQNENFLEDVETINDFDNDQNTDDSESDGLLQDTPEVETNFETMDASENEDNNIIDVSPGIEVDFELAADALQNNFDYHAFYANNGDANIINDDEMLMNLFHQDIEDEPEQEINYEMEFNDELHVVNADINAEEVNF